MATLLAILAATFCTVGIVATAVGVFMAADKVRREWNDRVRASVRMEQAIRDVRLDLAQIQGTIEALHDILKAQRKDPP